jgi:hypothetical protein
MGSAWAFPFRGVVMAMVLAALAGCATTPTVYPDPVAVMLNRDERTERRWDAAKQAERELPADPKRIKALRSIVWERGYPADWSNYAVDQLIAQDEAAAKAFLAKSIVLILDWDTLNYIFDIAVKRNWTDFVPALVRNYAKTTAVYKDAQRPERKAIEKLAPGEPIEQVVMRVFASDSKASVEQRAAAWQLLTRLTADRAKMRALLAAQKPLPDDTLLADLQAVAADLGVVPVNLETVTWVRLLRTPEFARFYEQCRHAVSQLGEEQKQNLDPRHLPVLVYLDVNDPSQLKRPRAELLAELRRFLASQQHHLKGPNYDGPMEDHPQELSEYEGSLCWADLAVLHVMTAFMSDRPLVAQWFAEGDADIVDTTTEYGGLVRIDPQGHPAAQLYKPLIRQHNYKYVPPKEIVFDAYTALAHFHFHAQEYANRRFAGPGIGDMDLVRRHQFNALVLTFIDKDRLNVDYYQAPDSVIDLGTITR